MSKEQMATELYSEAKEFVKFLKSLNEKQQIGINLTIQGLRLLAEKQKKRYKNR